MPRPAPVWLVTRSTATTSWSPRRPRPATATAICRLPHCTATRLSPTATPETTRRPVPQPVRRHFRSHRHLPCRHLPRQHRPRPPPPPPTPPAPTPLPAPTPPTPPSNLAAMVVTPTSITLDWQNNADNE